MHHQTRGRRPGGGGRGMGSGYRGHQPRDGGNRHSSGILDHPPVASGSGALRTEHLQLHELDLELALLKRKRELIEQQQNLLSESSYGRGNQYDFNEARGSMRQPEYNEPRSAPARNIAHYYDEGAPARYDRPRSPVHRPPVKRPADNWPQSGPKRFNTPRKRTRPAPREQRAAPPPARPPPQSRPSGPPPKPHNLNHNKVTKPNRPAPAPNKMNSYPVNERKNLVSQASHLAKESDEFILRENVPASKKLVGRLELALGYYLKELRAAHEAGPYEAVFRAPLKLRSLKQSIRERIRTAMLGKAVGTAKSVMTCVRAAYPENSDDEILKLAQATEPLGAKLAILPVDAVDPEKYLKQNFNMLLGRKLTEIFDKIQKLYCDDMEMGKSTQETIDTLYLELNQKMGQELDQLVINGVEPSETADGSVANGKDSVKTENEEKPEVTEETKTAVVAAHAETADIPIEPIENPLQTVEEVKEGDVKPTEVVECDVKPTDVGDNLINDANIVGYRLDPMDRPAAFYNKLVDVLLKRRLPQLLPKFKDLLIKILHADLRYTDTKAYLIQQANKKAEAMYAPQQTIKVEPEEAPGASAAQEGQKAPPKGQRIFPFFVKIMGRPNLPKRKNMQTFLDQYHPASIKKHRGIHNLLFIALNSQQDYDNLMAANNTVIGNSVLDIRVGGKGKGETRMGQNNSSSGGAGDDQNIDFTDDNLVTNELAAKANINDVTANKPAADDNPITEDMPAADEATMTPDENMSKILDESLDDQISDLLSSIRKVDEETLEQGSEICDENDVETSQEQCSQNDGENAALPAEVDDVQIVNEPQADAVIEIDDQDNQSEQVEAEADVEVSTEGVKTRRASTRLAKK